MLGEKRKRWKKHKTKQVASDLEPQVPPEGQVEGEPSWVVKRQTGLDSSAPFGHVDVEVKAYFRTVDIQIRDWLDVPLSASDDQQSLGSSEERRLFFIAALTEMIGKEKQLATDPDCSHILERILHSMDDFARRVFVDRLAGSHEELVKNRYASHVCQTMLLVASDTVSRESKGLLPSTAEISEHGELRTMTRLVLDICEELYPHFTSLVSDPFASHVIRVLLLLLWPSLAPTSGQAHNPMDRSKKSARWAARQGPLKSVFAQFSNELSAETRAVPDDFRKMAIRFVQLLRKELTVDETKAFVINSAASPVVQMILEIEADINQSDVPNSIMDKILEGLISAIHAQPSPSHSESDFLASLLRDPTSSHLCETLISRAPSRVFDILWPVYFLGKVSRLAVHPIANFVLARALARCSPSQLREACDGLDRVAEKAIKTHRTASLRSLIDRAADLGACEENVTEIVFRAFGLERAEDHNKLVLCALQLATIEDCQLSIPPRAVPREETKRRKTTSSPTDKSPSMNTQGALLLQSLLRLPQPHNESVIKSTLSLSPDVLLPLAQDSTSSRVLDALIDSPTVSRKDKRAFVMSFIGHFQLLVDDRIGSRVADRCWAFADPYLREKIARSLIPHEQFLAGSFYGKYFAKILNLPLLRRQPEEWKDLQAARRSNSISDAPRPTATVAHRAQAQLKASTAAESTSPLEVDDRRRAVDEIDALFDTSLGKGVRRGALESGGTIRDVAAKSASAGEDLGDLLGAIRAAPSEKRKSRHKH